MASIRKRVERWHLQIRRQETSPIPKSFTTKTDAKAWALQTEALVESGKYQMAGHDFKTLKCLIIRYRDEISQKKKGAYSETCLINHMLKSSITKKPVTELRPSLFAIFRDDRLRLVSPSSVRRELVTALNCELELVRSLWYQLKLDNFENMLDINQIKEVSKTYITMQELTQKLDDLTKKLNNLYDSLPEDEKIRLLLQAQLLGRQTQRNNVETLYSATLLLLENSNSLLR
jgi:hypothetical protein